MHNGNVGTGISVEMRTITTKIILKIIGKEGQEMMAMLWAQQIMKQETIEEAKEMYNRVPRLLKDKVKQILIDSGMEEIVE